MWRSIAVISTVHNSTESGSYTTPADVLTATTVITVRGSKVQKPLKLLLAELFFFFFHGLSDLCWLHTVQNRATQSKNLTACSLVLVIVTTVKLQKRLLSFFIRLKLVSRRQLPPPHQLLETDRFVSCGRKKKKERALVVLWFDGTLRRFGAPPLSFSATRGSAPEETPLKKVGRAEHRNLKEASSSSITVLNR